MNCYKFEENITKFIDNELKQDFRKLFLDHRDSCDQCCKKLENINNNILTFNQFEKLKTSDNFLDGLNQKIYNYNNNPSIWKKIKSFKIFETPPVYALGYSAALLLCIFSSYSLINMDRINYEDLNNKVTASLNKNVPQNDKQYIVDEKYGLDRSQIVDAGTNINKQAKQNKKSNNNKSIEQPIMQVSNNNNRQNLNQRMRVSNNKLLESYNNQAQSLRQMEILSPQKSGNTKEDYIVNYEIKNSYFKKRKDSLKSILNNTTDEKIVAHIQKQIKIDSLDQLKFYRNFDKIMINEEAMEMMSEPMDED